MMILTRMLTGLVSLTLSRLGRVTSELRGEPEASRAHPDPFRMPEERARFIAAFLEYAFAFHKRKVISVFCHKDKPFPEVLCGGKMENIHVSKMADGWRVTFSLNRRLWSVKGYVDIELEDPPILRIESSTGSGTSIQMLFIPEGGYGLGGEYDLWAHARRALDDHDYFKFVGRGQ